MILARAQILDVILVSQPDSGCDFGKWQLTKDVISDSNVILAKAWTVDVILVMQPDSGCDFDNWQLTTDVISGSDVISMVRM